MLLALDVILSLCFFRVGCSVPSVCFPCALPCSFFRYIYSGRI
ncbi:hypothetical protein MtrunA17_Chr7g0240851 [Medicago truncatula]|uniref:Transmembrane protein n=1 Tax=Medicago truncatula TaxID=3880 RepID=A0A396H5T1_MEDTR|nr:hypothetical protein MtrunA17_Chr7g0240851 [Medicago truncatula]